MSLSVSLREPVVPPPLLQRWACGVRFVRLLLAFSPRQMALCLGASVVSGLAPLMPLFALRNVVDVASSATARQASLAAPLWWAATFAMAFPLQATVRQVAGIIVDRLQDNLKIRIQRQIIEKAQTLSLAHFELPEVYNRLQRTDEGANARLFGVLLTVLRLPAGLFQLITLAAYVGSGHWRLIAIIAVGTAIFVTARIPTMRRKYITDVKQTEPLRRLSYLADLMTGREAAAEVRLFGLGRYLLEGWERLHIQLQDERLALESRRAAIFGFSFLGESATFGLTLLVILLLVAQGGLTLGQYTSLAAAAQQFQEEAFWHLWAWVQLDNTMRYVQELFAFLDIPTEHKEDANFSDVLLRQGVTLERVSFTYPGSERPALSRINLHIRPGERIALVGANGAGKSTLARLLLGLYTPTEGRILVDGVDLDQIDPTCWRKRTAAVFQDFMRYHLTVRENIGFGDLERMDDLGKLQEAARTSGADAVIAVLPSSYDTQLGKEFEGGVELSQGQWQKIAIARTYMRDAELVVLDEPASALDARAEVEVYRRFRDVSEGRTVVLISHRLGTARLADRIAVLDAGRIVEEGSHDELMRQGRVYARMLGIQAQWYA